MDDIQKFLNSLSPYIRRAWDARMPVDWEIPLRFIYDYEICFIKAGTVNVWAEDTLYEGRAGDVFFFVPGQLHSIRSVGSERVWQPHIHFDFFFDEYSEGLEVPIKMPHPNEHMRRNVFNDYPSLKIPTKTTFSNPYEADELISRIIAECAGLDPLKAIRCKSLLFDLLYLLLSRRFAPSGGAGEKDKMMELVNKANRFIQQNCDKPLSMREVSDYVGYSPNYFAQAYKKIVGLSPVDYHAQLRIEKAKNYILMTNLSMSDIAEELGFDSLYSFSRYFKRAEGVSPLEFRTATNNKYK